MQKTDGWCVNLFADYPTDSAPTMTRRRSQFSMIWFRFRKNRLAVMGLVLFVTMALLALSANVIADYESRAVSQNLKIRFQAPSSAHIFGTDQYGRDVFARILHGGRISLFVGVITVSVSMFFGLLIGASAAYYGGAVDNVSMRFMDMLLAIPSMLMAITIVAALGNGLFNLLIALSIANIPAMARIVRSSVMTITGQEYIEAARVVGTKDARIILRHIMPNAIGPVIVQATLTVARTILTISSLSFIGLGITSPTPEWGAMLSEAKNYMMYYPWLAIFPGVAIVLAVMGLTLVGDGLRDALDPRLKN